jgi:hypothetical protein
METDAKLGVASGNSDGCGSDGAECFGTVTVRLTEIEYKTVWVEIYGLDTRRWNGVSLFVAAVHQSR